MSNSRVIDVDLSDSKSIAKANRLYKKYLKEIEQDFAKRVKKFLQRLANLGATTMQKAYGSGVTVSVCSDKDQSGFVITANGKAVVFLEFGAGILTDAGDMYASKMPFPVYEGSYSELVGTGEFYTKGVWHFGGKEYQYIVPRNGMEKAYEEIMANIQTIADEVFK